MSNSNFEMERYPTASGYLYRIMQIEPKHTICETENKGNAHTILRAFRTLEIIKENYHGHTLSQGRKSWMRSIKMEGDNLTGRQMQAIEHFEAALERLAKNGLCVSIWRGYGRVFTAEGYGMSRLKGFSATDEFLNNTYVPEDSDVILDVHAPRED